MASEDDQIALDFSISRNQRLQQRNQDLEQQLAQAQQQIDLLTDAKLDREREVDKFKAAWERDREEIAQAQNERTWWRQESERLQELVGPMSVLLYTYLWRAEEANATVSGSLIWERSGASEAWEAYVAEVRAWLDAHPAPVGLAAHPKE
jgi:chromosome segregation ATPase